MKCPFCDGEISDSAVRCRHCAKSLLPTSYGQEMSGVRKPPTDVALAPPPRKPGVVPPPTPESAATPGANGPSAPPATASRPAATPPATASRPAATPPPTPSRQAAAPPPTPSRQAAAPPAAAPSPPAASPPEAPRGFVGGPPKDWRPGAPPTPLGAADADAPQAFGARPAADPPAAPRGFAGGPPKDWNAQQQAEAPRGFAGGPPKDWNAQQQAEAPRGFAGGPPKDWNAQQAEAPRGFAGGPPKDWNTQQAETPPKRGFAGAPPPGWKPDSPSEAPRQGFAGGPPKDWGKSEAARAGADDTLWAFAQDIPTDREDRVAEESDRQREAQREAVLSDVRDRAEAINAALEGELPEQVLGMAYTLKEYILQVKRNEDPELEAELDKVQAVITQLEKAGYRLSMLDMHEGASLVSKTVMTWVAIVLVGLGLAAWAIYAVIKANDEANAKYPGRITGTVGIMNKDNMLTRVPLENVRIVADTPDARALLDKLTALHNKPQAFAELKTKRGVLPAVAESQTNQVGQFAVDKVPPGKYFVIVVTAKNEADAGAWMVPLEVFPTKITDVQIAEENRIK